MQVYSGWVNCHQSVSKAGLFDDFVRPSIKINVSYKIGILDLI